MNKKKSECKKSNVPKGETRLANITFIVDGGASWAINNLNFTFEQIERVENMLLQLIDEFDKEGD